MTKSHRVKGVLRTEGGKGAIPITSARVVEAIRERDEALRAAVSRQNYLQSECNRLRSEIARLRRSWWLRARFLFWPRWGERDA